MVVVKLLGGLGNQMFQYALGRRLSLEQKCALNLDSSVFATYKVHGYELNRYQINGKEVSQLFSLRMKASKRLKSVPVVGNLLHLNLCKEKSLRFDESVLKHQTPLLLEGYWQSEKYFKSIRKQLLQDFTLKALPSRENEQWLERIKQANSVSLHIRRGDYVTNPNANQVHGVMPLSYYANAVETLSQRQKDLEFFIFSDDPAWVRENLKVAGPMNFVNNNVGAGYEDLRLMQNCKHNIIANSSFSWWAAWLNNNPNKSVLAPARWFNDPNMDATDIVPEDWIKVPLK